MLNSAELYYFSPTGGTKQVGEIFCQGIAENVELINLGLRDTETKQPDGQLFVAAAPVFGGRIPSVMAEKLNQLDGKGKPAVTLAVYGVRAYEDALLEMNRILEARGFEVVASAALIARHSIVPEVGAGRPDEQDQKEILDFAEKTLEKIGQSAKGTVKVPGNYPYKDGMHMSASPISLPACHQCGKCAAVCPVGAIEKKDGEMVTDPEKCILCMACTAACPEHARILPPPLQEGMNQKLGALKDVRRENEFFL